MAPVFKFSQAAFLIVNFFLVAIPSAISQGKEHIHIHLDRNIYLPGETIFFKAYLFQNNIPSPSSNLYAAMYSSEGSLLQQKTYPIFFGTAQGDFQIPDDLKLPAVQLRLFTKNMAADS